jgi:MFS family permease
MEETATPPLRAPASTPSFEGRAAWCTAIAGTIGLTFGPSVLTVFAFGTFIAPLEHEFRWGVPAISLGASVITLMIVVTAPLQGTLVDRFGGRRIVLTSIPLFGTALIGMSFLPGNILVFYLAWAVVVVCGIGLWPVSYSRLTAGWFDRRLGLALGVTNAGIGVGSVLVPVLAAALIAAFGWRGAFVGLGAVALLVFPAAYALITDAPRRPTASGGDFPDEVPGDTVRTAARTREFWLGVGVFFLLGLFSQATVVHQVRLLLDAGIPPRVANLVPAVLGIALIGARIGTGWLLDRFAVTRVLPTLLACGVVATLLLAAGPSIPLALLAAALTGLLIGAEFDVLAYLVPRYFGRRAFGQIYAINFSAFNIAGAIAIYAAGVSRAASGS